MANIWRMARPKKDPALLRDETLRIPVSQAEKQQILAAVASQGGEFAGWARALLLNATGGSEGRAGSLRRTKEPRKP